MTLDLSSFEKAVSSLKRAILVAKDAKKMRFTANQKETIRAGVIQNFEFTYELSWKFMKRWLELNLGSSYVDGVSRKELFRIAAENQLLDDVENWMDYHEARNKTVHTYDPLTAQEIFEKAQDFLLDAKKLLSALKSRND